MNAIELMTMNPACCQSDTPLQTIASLMVEKHCGAIPVVDDNNRPIGLITDRDIVCRTVAKGVNPLDLTAENCMTTPAVTVSQDSSLDECCQMMEADRIRRLLVVDEQGLLTGIIAQADIARVASTDEIAEIEQVVSEPSEEASRIVH